MRKHFHFLRATSLDVQISHLELTGCCWEQSSITQGQLSGCGSYLSFSLSSLQIHPHTYSHNPKTARLRSIVGSPLTKHSMLAGSQQRGTWCASYHCVRWCMFAAVKLTSRPDVGEYVVAFIYIDHGVCLQLYLQKKKYLQWSWLGSKVNQLKG